MVNKITIVHFFTIVILFTILAIDKISGYRYKKR